MAQRRAANSRAHSPRYCRRSLYLAHLDIGTRSCHGQGIYVPYQRVNELINRRRGLTPSTALRLAKYFGTSPDFWMNLQLRWELYHTRQAEAHELKKIKKVKVVRTGARLPLIVHKPAGHGAAIWGLGTAYSGLATASYNWVMGSRNPGSTSPPSKVSVRSKTLTCVGD
jgi:addiction module HigA family antidote